MYTRPPQWRDYQFRRFFCPATMNASASGGKSVPERTEERAIDACLYRRRQACVRLKGSACHPPQGGYASQR